ncbi:hypothetical protein F511_30652 [Dorcoceras hygrometricum]|uniref:Uncharacterized protein n=1 Tax=Dorcoceras hygrometricum TaxID=472368 RepID=A0A2Z7C8K2_9LAMI|nr:hypothetical protein F511_30652 [Dorcoceras hygrometricum]
MTSAVTSSFSRKLQWNRISRELQPAVVPVQARRRKTHVYVVSHTVAAVVHLRSLGVLTAAGCGIGSVHAVVRSNLLVEPSEVEEGEIILTHTRINRNQHARITNQHVAFSHCIQQHTSTYLNSQQSIRSKQSAVNSDLDCQQSTQIWDSQQSTQIWDSQLSLVNSQTVNTAGQQLTQLWTGQLSFGRSIQIWRRKFRFGDANSDLATKIQICTDVSVVIWVYGLFRTLSYVV